ncbi:MAG: gliding motility-associated protein GldE [Muribaculaceae bacterium]|nr:gliding motility-associated protein GldE [Muribaculaceae bacterium]
MSPSGIIALIIALFCLVISGFVSGSELSFFSLTSAQIDEIEDRGQNDTVRRLLSNPEKLLATILIVNNLVNVTIVVLCNYALGPVFSGLPPVWSFILQSVILTFLILLFGEIIPKLYSTNYAVRWAEKAAPALQFITRIFGPFARLLVGSTSIVKSVVPKSVHEVTTDDLSQALELTAGATKSDKEMLEGILRYGDTRASEIMTPRIDMTDLAVDMPFDKVLATVIESGYSRIPVYEGNEDNIRGILFSRDLLPYIGKVDTSFDWTTLLREPYFVPEARKIDDLLEDFRKRKQHLAVVVDEYGGTQGIVTLEDVLEEIVGAIDDEYDEPETTFKRLRDNTYEFEGKTALTDFFRVTGLDEEDYAPVAADAETLAGMLLAIKGDFPKEKEPLVYGRCRFLILDMAEHRIQAVRVKVMPEESQDTK